MGSEKEEPRFLIDACLTAALPEHLLHHRGVDAVRVDKLLRPGADDRSIVALAREQGRVIVTENAADFRRLAENNLGHPGLVIIAGSLGRQNQIALTTAAVDRILSDIKQDILPVGHVYVVAANGSVKRYKLPR